MIDATSVPIYSRGCLIHWGRHFPDDIFKCIFLNTMSELKLEFQRILFLKVQFTIFQHWFRWWLGANQATSISEPMMVRLLTHIRVNRPQWVNFHWSNHFHVRWSHYSDVIMTTMVSQITSLAIVYSIVYSVANQRKHQSSVSLAFVRRIHRWPVNSSHKRPVTRKMFPFDDVIMRSTPFFQKWLTKSGEIAWHFKNDVIIRWVSSSPFIRVGIIDISQSSYMSSPTTRSWGQHGAHMGPTGPMWAPCWPHEPCYLG